MVKMLESFGSPCYVERREPQLMLAAPVASCRCGPDCRRFDVSSLAMCSPTTCPITQLAMEGASEDGLQELAARLRPDIEVGVRVFHLKQAMEQVGNELEKLEGYFCLCSLTLPYSREDIDAVSAQERFYRENIRCQIDLAFLPPLPAKQETRRFSALHSAPCVSIVESSWRPSFGRARLRARFGKKSALTSRSASGMKMRKSS